MRQTSGGREHGVEIMRDAAGERADALEPLRAEEARVEELRVEAYSLFVPRRLAPGLKSANLRKRIGDLPVATSIGDQFRERLETYAKKAKWPLCVEMGGHGR